MSAFARERGQAMICASVLCVSWMVGLSSWTPYSIEQFLTGEHTLSTHASAWAVMDTLCAVVVLAVARFTWWGPVLFGFLFAGCLNDTLLWSGFTKWKSFSGVADAMFLAEEAVFFALGGKGASILLGRVGRYWLSGVRRKTGFLAS